MIPFIAYYKDGNFVYEEVEAPYNPLGENEIKTVSGIRV